MRRFLKRSVLIGLIAVLTVACGQNQDMNERLIVKTTVKAGGAGIDQVSKQGAFQSRILPVETSPQLRTITTWTQPLVPVVAGNLYVVLSGNGSCPKGEPSRVAPGLQENELFMAFNQWIFSGGVLTANDRVIYACYEWQSPQMKFYDLKAERQMLPIFETQIPELVVARMQGFGKIFIVGHSHAGWLAMKLASSPLLLSRATAPIALASIDPVSRVTCQRLREPGCREAPRDFTVTELQNLNTRTRWLNLYHQPAIILGSGPITQAHQNIRVNANHVAMQMDATVWQNVRQFFLSFR
jgi:hypothetical protein